MTPTGTSRAIAGATAPSFGTIMTPTGTSRTRGRATPPSAGTTPPRTSRTRARATAPSAGMTPTGTSRTRVLATAPSAGSTPTAESRTCAWATEPSAGTTPPGTSRTRVLATAPSRLRRYRRSDGCAIVWHGFQHRNHSNPIYRIRAVFARISILHPRILQHGHSNLPRLLDDQLVPQRVWRPRSKWDYA